MLVSHFFNHINPYITISNKRRVHKFQRYTNHSIHKFDGIGSILGHVYYLGKNNSPLEIHIGSDAKWYLKKDDQTPKNKTNMFFILILK